MQPLGQLSCFADPSVLADPIGWIQPFQTTRRPLDGAYFEHRLIKEESVRVLSMCVHARKTRGMSTALISNRRRVERSVILHKAWISPALMADAAPALCASSNTESFKLKTDRHFCSAARVAESRRAGFFPAAVRHKLIARVRRRRETRCGRRDARARSAGETKSGMANLHRPSSRRGAHANNRRCGCAQRWRTRSTNRDRCHPATWRDTNPGTIPPTRNAMMYGAAKFTVAILLRLRLRPLGKEKTPANVPFVC